MSRRIIVLTVLAMMVALALPATASANPFFMERTVTWPIFTAQQQCDTAGDVIVYQSRGTLLGTGKWEIVMMNMRTESVSTVGTSTADLWRPHVTGDWIIWWDDADNLIHAKNMKTGVATYINYDVAAGQYDATADDSGRVAFVTNASGSYDVFVYDLTKSVRTLVAGGSDTQTHPCLSGNDVVFTNTTQGDLQLARIGSAAPPVNITTDGATNTEADPTMNADWIAWSDSRGIVIYDRSTGATEVVAAGSNLLSDPQLQGDLVYYTQYTDGGTNEVMVYDIRANFSHPIADSAGLEENLPRAYGDSLVYQAGSGIVIGRIARPALTGAISPTAGTFGQKAKFTGTLSDFGHYLAGANVQLERRDPVTGAWSTVGMTTTNASGAYSFTTPANYSAGTYRVAYTGNYSPVAHIYSHLSQKTGAKTFLPKARISRPAVSKTTPTHGKTVKISGTLEPRHTAGTKPVRIQMYKRSGGRWVLKKTVSATASNFSTYSKYSVSTSFSSAGSWRIRAYYPKSSTNYTTYSSYRYLTVR